MEKKYELTDITMENNHWISLYRIRALKDFQTSGGDIVKAGDLGGWVENGTNLSQKGNCWIFDDAQVFEAARVGGNAQVVESARVYGNAHIHGIARICRRARISGSAVVYGSPVIMGEVIVSDDACVYGCAHLSDNAHVLGKAKVHEHASLSGDVIVRGSGEIRGSARLTGRVYIGNNADIISPNQVLSIGPIGSRCDTTTFYISSNNDIWVGCGCFNGNISKFEQAVKDRHGDNKFGKEYMLAIQFARKYFDLDPSEQMPLYCRLC